MNVGAMEGAAKQKEGSVPDSFLAEWGRTWAKVVGGQSRQLVWTSHKVLEVEVGQLWRFFSKMLEFLENEMDEARRQ